MPKRFSKYAGTFDQVQANDLIFMNNPVLIQGLGLTPVIMAAVSLKNACMLAFAVLVIGTLTRCICGFMHRSNKFYLLRPLVYSLVASLAYIPVLYALTEVFGKDVRYVGIYLPLIIVDQIVLMRSESLVYERPDETLAGGLKLSIGFAGVIIVVGALREFLAKGMLWGKVILEAKPLPIMDSVVGGFIVVAVFAAGLQALVNAFKRNIMRRTKFNV